MRNIWKFLVLAAGTTAIGGGAMAADVYSPPPVEPSPVYSPTPVGDWSGFYLGIQGGYDWNRSSTISPSGFTSAIDGGLVGIYGGYNWQVNNVVFGLDASINYDWASGPVVVAPNYRGEVDWKGFLRGRLGVAVADSLLIYGTAGGSFANLKLVDTTPPCPGAGGSAVCGNPSAWGWTIGAGAEWAFRPNMIARLDYAYADYGTYSYANPVAFTATNNSHTLTLGLAMKY